MTAHPILGTIPKQAQKHFEKNRNVLVIEDDKVMGQMITEILEDLGFNVAAATNGPAAFEQLRQKPVDFIILDILLPEMDGFEIYSGLQTNPATQNIPVMIVSAWSDTQNIDKASQMGIRHFLSKPFTEDELVSAILTLLVDHAREK